MLFWFKTMSFFIKVKYYCAPELPIITACAYHAYQCLLSHCSTVLHWRCLVAEFGLFFADDDQKKGIWLENNRNLEYYLLRSGVSFSLVDVFFVLTTAVGNFCHIYCCYTSSTLHLMAVLHINLGGQLPLIFLLMFQICADNFFYIQSNIF